jgi:hypothetical protein
MFVQQTPARVDQTLVEAFDRGVEELLTERPNSPLGRVLRPRGLPSPRRVREVAEVLTQMLQDYVPDSDVRALLRLLEGGDVSEAQFSPSLRPMLTTMSRARRLYSLYAEIHGAWDPTDMSIDWDRAPYEDRVTGFSDA